MTHISPILSDLALILIVAGLVTIIFKRLGQPLVLGYIVAGFLSGPHMPYTPSVEDLASINTWSEIGVIFLMFTLGLEFSFKKVLHMGMTPVIAACLIICTMMGIGGGLGHLMGWSSMNSLFLGGMLAMSSTTIIYKAFEDLGIRGQKFAGEVLSVLILEDILGILLMVILTALAASRQFEGFALVESLGRLSFFLILWFVVGVYVVPLFLRRNLRWINRETLLIISLGLCFLLVIIAAKAGYSTAFGAFMMGSILAETLEADRIMEIVSPVKDLFGAIFFVSVGMLVDPQVLVDYMIPISLITLSILLGQTIFGSCAFLLSGQSLKVAMQCGFSMAQIGEFSFIIASLGISLQVMDSFLYPVVVAVSIITTFFTPYIIRTAVPTYQIIERVLPDKLRYIFQRNDSTGKNAFTAQSTPGRRLLTALSIQVGIYLTLSIAVIGITLGFALSPCRHILGDVWGSVACGIATLSITSPFLRAIVMRKNHSAEWKELARRGRIQRLCLFLTGAFRFLLSTGVVAYVIHILVPEWDFSSRHPHLVIGIEGVASVLIVTAMIASQRVKYVSIRLERTFRQNLHLRENWQKKSREGSSMYVRRLRRHDVHIAQVTLPWGSVWGGKRLSQLDFGHGDGILIAAIVRGDICINIPSGDTQLFPGDRIDIIGDDEGIAAFSKRLDAEVYPSISRQDASHHLHLRRLTIHAGNHLVGTPLRDSGIRDHFHCMIVGFEEGPDEVITTASSSRLFQPGDIMWVVGEMQDLNLLEKNLSISPSQE